MSSAEVNQSVNSAESPYDTLCMSSDYRKQVSFSENPQNSSVEGLSQQSHQNHISNQNQVKKKRRKSIPHKAHRNFINTREISQEMVPGKEEIKPVALFMKQEPGVGVVDLAESDSRAVEYNSQMSDQSRSVHDAEEMRNEMHGGYFFFTLVSSEIYS